MNTRRPRTARTGRPDYLIIAAVFALLFFGLAMLASASSHIGQARFGDTYYYLKHQLVFGVLGGIIGFFLGAVVYYRRYERWGLFLLLGSFILTTLVFSPLGVHAKGATRWLSIGGFVFQPSELLKLTVVMYLAAWLSRGADRSRKFWSGFVPFILVLLAISSLLFAQHSTSIVALLIAVALILYFVSGARTTYLAGIAAVALLMLGGVILATPYRLERFMNFFAPGADPQAGGFHLEQARIAIGSGGLSGVGYGQSTTKITYLPEAIGDSIFAVAAEEFGFAGVALLIGLFSVLIVKMFLLAFRARDRFAQLLLAGFGSVIGLQAFINIGALTGLLPLTGMPLPFISYGGTALVVFMTMAGITVNISRYT